MIRSLLSMPSTFQASLFAAVSLVFSASWVHVSSQQEPAQQPQAARSQPEEIEPLTRGPLHEAFAEPHRMDARPSEFVREEPPSPIEEVPPDVRPEGQNVEWIPGYWAWEPLDERFVWVSGIWRDVPPGRRWVPGYWEKTGNGNRWVSGFWGDAEAEQLSYLPTPPESIEVGPSSPSPGPNYFYVPGVWLYDGFSYNWRPGYWAVSHDSWVWVPATYVWTPRGCIYRPGYWDFDIFNRGLVYAPIYFSQPIYARTGFVYSPWVVLDSDVNLLVHLFLAPNRYHYYFGDYYGAGSYYAWSDLHTRYGWYDPLFAYYDARPRTGTVNVVDWVGRQHQFFVENTRFRPRSTYKDQIQLESEIRAARDIDPDIRRLVRVAKEVKEMEREPDANIELRRISEDEKKAWVERTKPYRKMVEQRGKGEVVTPTRDSSANETRLTLPRMEPAPRRAAEPAPRRTGERAPERTGERAPLEKPDRGPPETKGVDRPREAAPSRPNDWPAGRRDRSVAPPDRPATEPNNADGNMERRGEAPTPKVEPRAAPPRAVPERQPAPQPKATTPSRATPPSRTGGQPQRQPQRREAGDVQRSYRPSDNQGDAQRPPQRDSGPPKQPPSKDKPSKDKDKPDKDGDERGD